jgi:hypothetical protein
MHRAPDQVPVPEGDAVPTTRSSVAATAVSPPLCGSDRTQKHGRPSPKLSRRAVIPVVIALVIVAGGVGPAFALARTLIPTRTGSATITWAPVPNTYTATSSPQPFMGTIEGMAASGVATMPLTAGSTATTSPSGAFPTKLEVAEWSGTLGGRPFKLGIFADYSSTTDSTNPTVTIVGRWGADLVKGRVDPPSAAELQSGNGPLHFSGTVGRLKVTGTVQSPTGRRHKKSVASFTVAR